MVYSFRRGPAGMDPNRSTTGDAARFAASSEVRTYWEALRDDQDLPRLEQINPRGMAGALHQVFMVERIAAGVARFRVAGMDINDVMGMEVRGMPLSALFDPAARARLAELLEKVVAARTIVEVDLEADRGIGRPALRARLLMLPVQGAAGEADLVLGCLAMAGQIGRTPRRFVIARACEHSIDRPAPQRLPLAVPDSGTRTAFAPLPVSLVHERAKPVVDTFVPSMPARQSRAKERPYLRLVHMED